MASLLFNLSMEDILDCTNEQAECDTGGGSSLGDSTELDFDPTGR